MSQRYKRSQNKSARRIKERVLQPPQLAIVPCIHHTFRFTNAATVTRLNLTFQSLLDLMCVAVTANSAYRLFGAVRLKSIKIWCAGVSQTQPATVSFQKFSSTTATMGANSKLYTDTVLGSASTAFVMVKFNDSEAVGQWQGVGSISTYGNITCPTGSIVDVTFSATLIEDNLSASVVTGAVAGATAGQTYVRSLDSAAGTTQLVPVSYFTV